MKYLLFFTNLAAQLAICYFAITGTQELIASRIRIGFASFQTIVAMLNSLALFLLFIGACYMKNTIEGKEALASSVKSIRTSLIKRIWSYTNTVLFGSMCLVYGFWWLFALEVWCLLFFLFRTGIVSFIDDKIKSTPSAL